MKNSKALTRWVITILLCCIGIFPLQAQKNIIFDTDLGPDCDDAGAMAVLHKLADLHEINILAVMSCTSSEWNAPCADAINTYYGRPDIPIGTLKEPGFLKGSSYNEYVAKNFPNDLKSGNDAPDAVQLYRQILAAQPDNSVTIIAVGPLRNIKNLLQSGPDANSPLNGISLVAQKVKEFSCMGGAFPSGSEWNFNQDGVASQYVINHLPANVDVVFSPMNIGSNISTGARLTRETPVSNPVRKAYEKYAGVGRNNSSWDQTAVLYAARGLGDYWSLIANGYCNISSDGSTKWESSPDKNQSYLSWKTQAQKEMSVIIEDLMVQLPLNFAISNPVTSISLTPTISTLALGEELSLAANVLPIDATIAGVRWVSSNPAVATVAIDGVVSAVGQGKATITAITVNGAKKATCDITTVILGSVIAEYWTRLTGSNIPAIMPVTLPGKSSVLYSLEVPSNIMDNYLVRLKGYIIPTTSGIYNLYIASDDVGTLWLSSDANPANKTQIARVDDHTSVRAWTKSANQKSANITLTAGEKYYFEAIMKEGGGGDNLAVGWTGPGISTITVIGGSHIVKFVE